jgi:hypothetical protein
MSVLIFTMTILPLLQEYIVTWRLKAGIVQTNKAFIARYRLGKHVPAATNKHATTEILSGYDDENGVFCWVRPETI